MHTQDFAGERTSRPWIQPESYEGFAGPFLEAAQRWGCNLDISVHASGDCGFHCVIVLQELLLSFGVEPMGAPGTVMARRPIHVHALGHMNAAPNEPLLAIENGDPLGAIGDEAFWNGVFDGPPLEEENADFEVEGEDL